MTASMVGKPLACDEQTLNNIRFDYAWVCIELNALLPMVHSFQLKNRLSLDSIIVMVEYEWKLRACDTYKVFGHSCKASIEEMFDMLKIQNESDVLYACNSLVIIPDEVTSYLNIAAIIKLAP